MNKNVRHLVAIVLITLVITGCSSLRDSGTYQSSSVLQYLYPDEKKHIEEPGIPTLRLPLRVGIAFVPVNKTNRSEFTETAKAELIKRVADQFKGLPYVKSIEFIPSAYLRENGGFENLKQIKTMFQVDVVALIAYDQIQFVNEGFMSLAYWTIVGAYTVKGEKNDTQTMMDCVLFDIESRKLLFRAPGTSRVKASATPVNLQEQLRTDGLNGFNLANTEMITNLKAELENFRVRVKETPADYKIEHRSGYSGGGAFDGCTAIALAVLGVFAWRKKR